MGSKFRHSSSFRFVRIPFQYLDTVHLKVFHARAFTLLYVIRDIHRDEPNGLWWLPEVKAFMYHASFLRWIHEKATTELKIREPKRFWPSISQDLKDIRSRSLQEFIPPTNNEIAEDVVWLLEHWRTAKKPSESRLKLPISYVNLAKRFYAYSPQGNACSRIEELSGCRVDDGRRWYFDQSQEAAQLGQDFMEAYLRGGSYDG